MVIRDWRLWLFTGGIVLALAWVWLDEPLRPSAIPPIAALILADDINQHRLNTAVPTPAGELILEQTFTAQKDGLREIELILVRRDEPAADENGRLTLTLFTQDGRPQAEQTLETRNLHHNQTYVWQIPRQADSAGQAYVLQISGSPDNPVSVWGYDLDAVSSGKFLVSEGDTAVQDLRFITRYQLGWGSALGQLGQTAVHYGFLFLLALAFLLLPGCLILLLGLRWASWDGMAWGGTALAVGTAVWPVVWYLFSLVGGSWTGWLLWLVLLGGWGGVLVLVWRVWARRRGETARNNVVLFAQDHTAPSRPYDHTPYAIRHTPRIHWQHVALMLILLIGFGVRLLAVRDLNIPPWVDASRHALITAVMTENGRTLQNYAPYLTIDRFPYHFGFHTISASLMLMGNWRLESLLLNLGQLLNALVPLTIYAAAWLMTRRRNAALIAAFLAAIPFFFPGYYATWGRFTQLTGVLILPVLLAFTWLLLRGARRWRRLWWLAALLVGGLFLVHLRVFVFYVPFAFVVWLMSWGRHGRYLLATAVGTFLLILPRLLYLQSITEPVKAISYNLPGYNQFPTGYYQAGWDRYFIWLAGLLLLWVAWQAVRKRPWAMLPLALAAWTLLLLFMLSGDYLGLPSTSLVNLNSLYITLFVPLAIFLGVTLDQLWRWLGRQRRPLQAVGYFAAGMAATLLLIFGIRQQISILNPNTILARPSDLAGLEWLDENLSPDALVAVNSWLWLGNTYAGADGGAWIVPLTRRQATIPPADYVYNRQMAAQVNQFNKEAEAITDWSDPAAAVWLYKQGVSHIFIGAKGGFMDPAALARNPNLQMMYGEDGVFIFEVALREE
ncbi:MAG: hypothetical protein HF973_02965 [Chloroflexi bacterium]|nr:hypothetical protein [Chloroflexota bacterium]